MFQGHSKEITLNQEPFPFDVSKLSFILLTHAHIDHSGRIPKIYKDGFKGTVYTTTLPAIYAV
jgi:metallo-beta-lactamase family protein